MWVREGTSFMCATHQADDGEGQQCDGAKQCIHGNPFLIVMLYGHLSYPAAEVAVLGPWANAGNQR
jgi:hypothetical protein